MPELLHQRCFNHALREAAARCPDCGHFFCRECITEHEDRVLCAACLRKRAPGPLTRRRGFVELLRGVGLLTGLFTVWLFFYLSGRLLLKTPHSFHEGTVWRDKWLDSQ